MRKDWLRKVRKKYTEVEKEIMKQTANNLKAILEKKRIAQKELAEMTGLSTSAISDYINAKTLMSPSVIFLIAEKVGVANGDIDSRYRNSGAVKESSPSYLTGEALDEIPIEKLALHNLTKNGKPLNKAQKERLVQFLLSASDLLDQ